MNGFDGTNKSPPDGEEVNYTLNSIVTLEPRSKSLPNYPLLNYRNSLVVINDGNVLSLGGRVTKNCYIFGGTSIKDSTWKPLTKMSQPRYCFMFYIFFLQASFSMNIP